MDDKESLEMMQRCREEIIFLRGRIVCLTPKAEAYDNMAALIALLPRKSEGYGEDLAWLLGKRIDEMTANLAVPSAQPPSHPYPEPEAATGSNKLPVRPHRTVMDDLSLEDEAFVRDDRMGRHP